MARKTFLLVENDAYQVLLIEVEFQRVPTNAQLRVVRDGFEAQQYLSGEGDYWDRQKHPIPDLILLDLRLPRLDGFEFLAWLRSQPEVAARLIPVVVLSALTHPRHITRAYELGANGYVVKAFEWEKLRDQVRGVCAFWGSHAQTEPVYLDGA